MHVLTGFLGSGKTTFLRRWLDFLNGRERYASVIQNEFGQVGLDAALTRSETRVEALDEGCVCCTLADALRPGLQRLLADAPAEQVILETTGLANPGNVLRSLDDLAEFVQPGLVITVVDSLEWHRGGYATQGVSGVRLSQVQQADVIIANKADTLAEKDFEDILRTLRACNAKACILPAVQGNIAFARLDAFLADWQDARTRPPSRQPRLPTLAQARGALGTHADEGFASHTLPMQAPVDESALRRMLDAAGPGLCRAKGIVDLLHAGGVVPAVVQYAAGQLEFEAAPQDEDARYLVFIGIDLAPREAVATARGGAVAASPAA
jgi:G3E family GTPase